MAGEPAATRFYYRVRYRLRKRTPARVRYLRSLFGKHIVHPADACTPEFVARHTSFSSYADLKRAAGLPDSRDDQSDWPKEDLQKAWDAFIAEQTEFTDCAAFLKEAARDVALRLLRGDIKVSPTGLVFAGAQATNLSSPSADEEEDDGAGDMIPLDEFRGTVTPIPIQEIPVALMQQLEELGHAEEIEPNYSSGTFGTWLTTFPRVFILHVDTRKLVYRQVMRSQPVMPGAARRQVLPGPFELVGSEAEGVSSQVAADKYVFDPILTGTQTTALTILEVGLNFIPFGAAMQAFQDEGITSTDAWISLGADVGAAVTFGGTKVAKGAFAVGRKLPKRSTLGAAVHFATRVDMINLVVRNPAIAKGVRITGLVLANGDLAFQGVLAAAQLPGADPAQAVAAAAQVIIPVVAGKRARKAKPNPRQQETPSLADSETAAIPTSDLNSDRPSRISGDALKAARKQFASMKSRAWMEEATLNAEKYTASQLERMQRGQAPIGSDGFPMEIHHKTPLAEGGANSFNNFRFMTRTEHRLGPNYKTNHPNLP